MYKPQRKIDQAAVRKSLRELEALFGKKPPDPKENAPQQRGESTTQFLNKEVRNES